MKGMIKTMNQAFLTNVFFTIILGLSVVEARDGVLDEINQKKAVEQQEFSHIQGAVPPVNLDLGITKKAAIKRNPFTFGNSINQVNGEDGSFGYIRSNSTDNIPVIELMGIIQKSEESSDIALIKINKSKTYLVQEGDEVSYEVVDPTKVVKIKQIDPLKIIVELGQLGSVIVVR